MPSAMAAQVKATACSACVNAPRDASSNSAPSWPGSAPAAATAAPRSSFLRPILSPRVPMVTRSPVATNPYTSTIQRTWELVGSRSALRAGTARFSTVRSME